MEFYNTERPHSALAHSTPAKAYDKGMLMETQAEPEQRDVLNRTLAA